MRRSRWSAVSVAATATLWTLATWSTGIVPEAAMRTYTADGRQFVASAGGGTIYAFALPGTAAAFEENR